ncbi:uridine kinase [Bacteroidia bacterium]|nr:uridine kinase [Bacteroidia bacterium]GHU79377.1 uridine kinase [Bacteroidia bacterium]
MVEKIRIYCKNNSHSQDFDAGVSLLEMYEALNVELPNPLTGARVNNKSQPLTYRCYGPKDVEFIDISDPSGLRSYVRSLCCVLSKAVNDLFPNGKIYIEHPVSKGYYCELVINREITDEIVEQIIHKMQEIIDLDIPFEIHTARMEDVVALFRGWGMEDKALLLETGGNVYGRYNKLGDHVDYYYGALLPSTKWIYLFGLEKHDNGLLLRIPDSDQPDSLQPFVRQDKMMNVFQELLSYQKAVKMMTVGELNRANQKGEISNLVKVSEALQERKIARIADEITAGFNNGTRIVLISGPSSSGKTTFCKRLQIELMANTLRPISISLDDYYVNRVDTPLDEEGAYDYESLYAIDLKLFNSDLKKILAGEEVALPTYDFVLGERVYKGNTIRMEKNSVLVMEGIHALNPLLLPEVDASLKYKVYVSALTTISLDHHNWISTTDNRLIRRIVRDFQFRNYSAQETISRWRSVRRGEDSWIFPFQEAANVMFNSAMLYELAALRRLAEPILTEVAPRDPEYAEAYRLLKFLRYFNYIDVNELPNTSLLREFVGGSSFR